jgi:hypothetical protein
MIGKVIMDFRRCETLALHLQPKFSGDHASVLQAVLKGFPKISSPSGQFQDLNIDCDAEIAA